MYSITLFWAQYFPRPCLRLWTEFALIKSKTMETNSFSVNITAMNLAIIKFWGNLFANAWEKKITFRSQFVRSFITFKWHKYCYAWKNSNKFIRHTHKYIRSMKKSSQKKYTYGQIQYEEMKSIFHSAAIVLLFQLLFMIFRS